MAYLYESSKNEMGHQIKKKLQICNQHHRGERVQMKFYRAGSQSDKKDFHLLSEMKPDACLKQLESSKSITFDGTITKNSKRRTEIRINFDEDDIIMLATSRLRYYATEIRFMKSVRYPEQELDAMKRQAKEELIRLNNSVESARKKLRMGDVWISQIDKKAEKRISNLKAAPEVIGKKEVYSNIFRQIEDFAKVNENISISDVASAVIQEISSRYSVSAN